MRNQKSPYTLESIDNLSQWQISSVGSCIYENDQYLHPPWPHSVIFDPNLTPNVYEDFPQYDYIAGGDVPSQIFYPQDVNILYPQDANPGMADTSFLTYDASWDPNEFLSYTEQSADESFFPTDNSEYIEEPTEQSILQYGLPTVTDFGTVALLLRHLIRVDVTADGSVFVYNFPAMTVAVLNAAGDRFYVKHPNGRALRQGQVIHLMAGTERPVKISRRGVTFSTSLNSLAYVVDESGTKSTTGKFKDLDQDLTMDVFEDGDPRSRDDLAQDNYRIASEAIHQCYPDGSELWVLGEIRVVQDRWGQVTVSQNSSETNIITSPTIRSITVESPLVNICINCYPKNYLCVQKDSYNVTSGYCGLIVQNRSQKAGLDRSGRLVIF